VVFEKLEKVLFHTALFLREYLGPGRSAFEFYRYKRDGIVARITERGSDRDSWPVAVAWVVAPYANPSFLRERLREMKSIPANFRFLGIHKRILLRMPSEDNQKLFSDLESVGSGLLAYTLHPSVELLMEPRRFPGSYAHRWPEIVEQIETYRFLERF